MKKNYKNILLLTTMLMFGLVGYSQNIKVSIINAQNTNDGSNDYYEADITIETIGGQADFKLGSGQLYFNYSTAAFGDNISASGGFEVTADYASGYFLGEKAGFTDFYDISTINDNTTSRVSWAFSQGVSSGAMTEIVSTTPKMMVHIKMTYVDVNEDPMIVFETDESIVSGCLDQFYTACGPFDSASTTLDCSATNDPQNVNVQFLDANLDSGGAVLSDEDLVDVSNVSIYPNPTSDIINVESSYEIDSVELFDLLGKLVLTTNQTDQISVSHLPSGVYLLRVYSENGKLTKKLIIE